MGEIADMMLDGTLCEACGTYMEGDGEGFPRYCSDACEPADFRNGDRYEARVPRFNRYSIPGKAKAVAAKVKCPLCEKRLKASGVGDHIRDVHPETQIITGDPL